MLVVCWKSLLSRDASSNLVLCVFLLMTTGINPIYGTESWRNLARSIRALSDANTLTYLAHEKRGDDEAMVDFLEFSGGFLAHKKIAVREKLSLYKISLRVPEDGNACK